MFDKLSWGHGKINIVVGVDGGLGSMGLRPNREHGFKVIGECPMRSRGNSNFMKRVNW